MPLGLGDDAVYAEFRTREQKRLAKQPARASRLNDNNETTGKVQCGLRIEGGLLSRIVTALDSRIAIAYALSNDPHSTVFIRLTYTSSFIHTIHSYR